MKCLYLFSFYHTEEIKFIGAVCSTVHTRISSICIVAFSSNSELWIYVLLCMGQLFLVLNAGPIMYEVWGDHAGILDLDCSKI